MSLKIDIFFVLTFTIQRLRKLIYYFANSLSYYLCIEHLKITNNMILQQLVHHKK